MPLRRLTHDEPPFRFGGGMRSRFKDDVAAILDEWFDSALLDVYELFACQAHAEKGEERPGSWREATHDRYRGFAAGTFPWLPNDTRHLCDRDGRQVARADLRTTNEIVQPDGGSMPPLVFVSIAHDTHFLLAARAAGPEPDPGSFLAARDHDLPMGRPPWSPLEAVTAVSTRSLLRRVDYEVGGQQGAQGVVVQRVSFQRPIGFKVERAVYWLFGKDWF